MGSSDNVSEPMSALVCCTSASGDCEFVLQTARHEREQADKKIAQLTAEVSELEKRLVEMRATEVERMNDVNRTCEEMVCKGCMLCNWLQCTQCYALLMRRT